MESKNLHQMMNAMTGLVFISSYSDLSEVQLTSTMLGKIYLLTGGMECISLRLLLPRSLLALLEYW